MATFCIFLVSTTANPCHFKVKAARVYTSDKNEYGLFNKDYLSKFLRIQALKCRYASVGISICSHLKALTKSSIS